MASRTSPFLVLLQFQYQTAAFICKPNDFKVMSISINSVLLFFILYLFCKNSGNTVRSHDRKCLALHCHNVKRKSRCLWSPEAIALIPTALLHRCGSPMGSLQIPMAGSKGFTWQQNRPRRFLVKPQESRLLRSFHCSSKSLPGHTGQANNFVLPIC